MERAATLGAVAAPARALGSAAPSVPLRERKDGKRAPRATKGHGGEARGHGGEGRGHGGEARGHGGEATGHGGEARGHGGASTAASGVGSELRLDDAAAPSPCGVHSCRFCRCHLAIQLLSAPSGSALVAA